MAIISSTGNTIVTGNDGALEYLYKLKVFLTGSVGWTVARSSDGTTAGAGDNIASFSDLSQYSAGVSESWMVLADPVGGREFLWERGNTTDTNWVLKYSPAAGFTGGAITGPPTATDEVIVHTLDAIMATGTNVAHFTADNAAPYGFAAYVHLSGNFSDAQGGYAMIPIDNSQPGETDPVVIFYDGGGEGFLRVNISEEVATATVGRCVAFMPGTTSFSTCPGLTYDGNASSSVVVFPNDAPQDNNADDVAAPILFCRRAGLPGPNRVKGFSSFMQWNGVIRAPGETFAGLARVSFGDVNFPWDETTTPSST